VLREWVCAKLPATWAFQKARYSPARSEGWTQQIQSAAALAKHDDRAHAVTPMEAVAGTLSKRKDKSALHLSRYVVDASRNAALSRGDLNKAQNVRHIAAVRGHLWPETEDCPMEQMAVNIAILNVWSRTREQRGWQSVAIIGLLSTNKTRGML
jgi:hypothetical protein